MKRIYKLNIALVAIVTALVVGGCKKSNEGYTAAPLQAHFTEKTGGTFLVLTSTSTFKVPVGITNTSTVDQPISIEVTTTTGAVAGTHYTITNPNIVIKAGKALDSIEVKSNFALYTSGRKDTLLFTIKQPSVPPSDYNSTYTLVLRGPCFEGEVNTDYATIAGAYKARENAWNLNGSVAYSNYGPYDSDISEITLTSPTTATFKVSNIYEVAGWVGTFKLDWTDINNRKVTCVSNRVGTGDAIGLAAYNINVEPAINPATAPEWGTFSLCNKTVTVKFMLGAYSKTTGALAGYLSAASGGGSATFSMVLTK